MVPKCSLIRAKLLALMVGLVFEVIRRTRGRWHDVGRLMAVHRGRRLEVLQCCGTAVVRAGPWPPVLVGSRPASPRAPPA